MVVAKVVRPDEVVSCHHPKVRQIGQSNGKHIGLPFFLKFEIAPIFGMNQDLTHNHRHHRNGLRQLVFIPKLGLLQDVMDGDKR